MTLGIAIAVARKRKGLRLLDLEKRSGVARSVLSRIETGKIEPSFRKVVKIARVLGISLERLAKAEARQP